MNMEARTSSLPTAAKALDLWACRLDIERAAAKKVQYGSSISVRQCLLEAGFDDSQASNRTMQARVRREVQRLTVGKRDCTAMKRARECQRNSFPFEEIAIPSSSDEADDDISVITDASSLEEPAHISPSECNPLFVGSFGFQKSMASEARALLRVSRMFPGELGHPLLRSLEGAAAFQSVITPSAGNSTSSMSKFSIPLCVTPTTNCLPPLNSTSSAGPIPKLFPTAPRPMTNTNMLLSDNLRHAMIDRPLLFYSP
eukprot:Nitzschia sp. Nitz4//scaffold93_size78505//32491//33261//NITZ4_005419-RA/size78505-processed-gene-0.101-mRNA-1//-1//CDS//3329560285//4026//frame0